MWRDKPIHEFQLTKSQSIHRLRERVFIAESLSTTDLPSRHVSLIHEMKSVRLSGAVKTSTETSSSDTMTLARSRSGISSSSAASSTHPINTTTTTTTNTTESLVTWPWHHHHQSSSVSFLEENCGRTDAISFLNTLDIITTLSSNFICKICHCFMIDICSFPCGHMFCKYCSLSWLRLQPSCPTCDEETFRPFATRCYEMDSVIDDFYPLISQFYEDLQRTKDGQKIVDVRRIIDTSSSSNNDGLLPPVVEDEEDFESGCEFVESIHLLRSEMESRRRKPIKIHTVQDRDVIRRRRRQITDRKDVLLAAPCTSILQKLTTLGWGTSSDEQSISYGMRLIVWAALSYAIYNFSFLLHHPWFDGVRPFVHSALILYSFNVIQMQLFDNPNEAPDMLNFELWEWVDTERAESESGTTMSTLSLARQSGNLEGNDDDDEDYDGSNSSSELEQILQWDKDGKVDYEQVFRIADELVKALQRLYPKVPHEEHVEI